MEQKQITATYAEAVKAIKEAILESRYRAARLVNKEVLALYYAIGGYISVQSRAARWGSNAIGTISELLQQELAGLRGFSETGIKRMRIFYEAWCGMFKNGKDLALKRTLDSLITANPKWKNINNEYVYDTIFEGTEVIDSIIIRPLNGTATFIYYKW